MNAISMVYNLLSGSLSVKAYESFVPEGEAVPAVSFVNIANPKGRAMDGVSQGRSSHWRVTVVASSLVDLGNVVSELENLDNTIQYEFAKIYSELVFIEPKDEDALYHRAFVDLTLY